MYHSITFGKSLLDTTVGDNEKQIRNTWDNWHLIPTSRPLVNPPTPSINRIQIPGADGSLDISEILAGRPTFSDRSGSWSFYAENGFMPWSSLYSEIMAYLHGQSFQCILEDDPSYYYEGRFSVNEWRSDASRSMITINYVVSPYKQFYIGSEDWLWDTLYFGDPTDPNDKGSSISSLKKIKVSGGSYKDIKLSGNFENALVRAYTSKSSCYVIFDGDTYALKKGKYIDLYDLELSSDSVNTLRLKYDGTDKAAYFSFSINGGML